MRYSPFALLALYFVPQLGGTQPAADYGRWPGTVTLESGIGISYVELYRAIVTRDIPYRGAHFVVSVDQFLTADEVEEFLCRFIAKKGNLIPASLGVSVHFYFRRSSYSGPAGLSRADEPLIAWTGCSDAARSKCLNHYFTDVNGRALRPREDLEFSCECLGGQSPPEENRAKDPD